MYRPTSVLVAFTLLALVAACDRGGDRVVRHGDSSVSTSADGQTHVVTDGATGERAVISTGPSAAAPANLPAYAPAYPGATIVSSVSADTMGGGAGGMLVMSTRDAPAQVIQFYRQRISQAGLTEQSYTEAGGTSILQAGRNEGGDGVQIAVQGSGGQSQITLMFGS